MQLGLALCCLTEENIMGFLSLENSRLGRHLTQMNISVLGLSKLFVIEVPFTEQPVPDDLHHQ